MNDQIPAVGAGRAGPAGGVRPTIAALQKNPLHWSRKDSVGRIRCAGNVTSVRALFDSGFELVGSDQLVVRDLQ